MQKQQKSLAAEVNLGDLSKQIKKLNKPLYEGSGLLVSHVEKHQEQALVKTLVVARRSGHMQCGFEAIASFLEIEEAGLLKVRQKPISAKSKKDLLSCSRLLIVSNDGSDRFYRHCEVLLTKYDYRMCGMKVDLSSGQLGELFFGKNKTVKAILITRKESVQKVFFTLYQQLRLPINFFSGNSGKSGVLPKESTQIVSHSVVGI